MSTESQIAANRLNSQLSTGPRTPEGKAASSANSTRHGFTAARLVVPPEQAAEFAAYKDSLIRDTHPEGAIEHELFDRLLLHGWSLFRIRAVEAQLVVDSGGNVTNPDIAHRLGLLARYRRDLERSYDRAMKELSRRQTERAILLQQENEAISKVYQITPLASLSALTNLTDPFFRVTRAVARTCDLAPSRSEADVAYQLRHAAYLERKARERNEAKAA